MLIVLIAGLLTTAQPGDSLDVQRVNADSLRTQAKVLEVRADSLKNAWDVLWKRSDSLRIESMLVRMKSNQLRRESALLRSKAAQTELLATSTDSAATRDTLVADDDAIVAALQARATIVRSGKQRAGQTLSDTMTAVVMQTDPDIGVASYYADAFHGKKTSSGEVFNMNDKTCAHRWLPFGTKLLVTNLDNGKSVVVRVNDRGPFHHGRLIDISKGAAVEIDMIRRGTARVRVEVFVEPQREDDANTDTEPAAQE